MLRINALMLVLLATPVVQAAQSDRNLALGKPVVFAPSPDYPLTSAGGTEVASANHRVIQAADGEYTRYTFSCRATQTEKNWGRLFLSGDWDHGKKGHLRRRLQWADREMPWIEQPIQAVHIDPVPQPRRLTVGLGWYGIESTLSWPESLVAYRTLGLNTVPLFARWVKREDEARVRAFLDKCRARGFKIMNVDSPFHHMMEAHRRSPEIYCQLEGGQHGEKMCPSYRGAFYRQEIERLADQTAKVKADFLSCDIELFGGVQTYAQKCSRCRADFQTSGCADWSEWCLRKGEEMWMDLSAAVRSRPGMAKIDMGGYDFRPGANYQNIWPVDRLYPKFMQNTALLEREVMGYRTARCILARDSQCRPGRGCHLGWRTAGRCYGRTGGARLGHAPRQPDAPARG